MPATYTGHGGGCCGYYHLFSMDNTSVEELDRLIRDHFETGGNPNRALEVILSARQVNSGDERRRHQSVIDAGGWPAVMASRGFRLGLVWRNSNTGNMCYQFIKLTDWTHNDSGDLPFTWTGGRILMNQPPVVEQVTRPITISVGDYVRATNGAHRGHVGRVTATTDASSSVQWEIGGTGESRSIRNEFLQPVRVVDSPVPWRREDGFPPLAPVDLTLPVEIVAQDGTAHPAEILRRPLNGESSVSARSLAPNPHVTEGARDLRDRYTYSIFTGDWSGQNGRTIGRLRNAVAPVVARPIFTTLTEFFAHFQNGRRSGPYETMEALREANPRVLSFVTRRVLSDGSVELSEPERIPATR